ncbi:hypothetical protein [Luteibacter sp. CQ10]|uniref:hypothetical protein n=1 Tax=Luteibacter sp. CQ10 TaxID=2805821 RepID=UPI0034A32E4D
MNTGNSPCLTGYASPGDRDYRWNPSVPAGAQPRPTPAAPVTEATIILCGRNDIPREGQIDPPAGPMQVDAIDAAGNRQSCRIGFVQGARDELTIS